MSTATTLNIITSGINVLNGIIELSENSSKYRKMVADAISENRELSFEDLEVLRNDAQDAINRARQD